MGPSCDADKGWEPHQLGRLDRVERTTGEVGGDRRRRRESKPDCSFIVLYESASAPDVG
jgi:hypothetical protein